MIQKIDDKTIMTTSEARKKYSAYFLGFVTTERNMEDHDNEKGYVLFLMDTYNEGYDIPRFLEDGEFVAVLPGYAVGGIELGGVIFD